MRGRPITYTAPELGWIRENSTRPRREMHADFVRIWQRDDVTLTHVNALCKRKGWMTGRTGQYDKGRVPENKGRKMPYNANRARTQFKKGNTPHTYKGPGHEYVDNKDGYVHLIIADPTPTKPQRTKTVLKHRYVWEQANGPVPEGMRLKCLDGDKTNTEPSNWEPIPMALAPRLNGRFGRGYDSAPAELKPTILATAKLEHLARSLKSRRD